LAAAAPAAALGFAELLVGSSFANCTYLFFISATPPVSVHCYQFPSAVSFGLQAYPEILYPQLPLPSKASCGFHQSNCRWYCP
jgi:hypothetical protein